MRFIPTIGWLALLGTLIGCRQLEEIPAGVCGNRVLEPAAGEDCDSPDASVCRPPNANHHPCRFACSATRLCSLAGAGCGADDVCRVAGGEFTRRTFEGSAGVGRVEVADLTGDGRDELLMTGSFERQTTVSFDADRSPMRRVDAPLDGESIVSGDLNCDGRQDVIGFFAAADESAPDDELFPEDAYEDEGSALKVLYADAAGSLVPVSQLVAPPLGSSRRLLSADADADGRAEPLLLVDRQLYSIPQDDSSRFFPLLGTDVPAALVAGKIPSGDWNPHTPCHEFALAEHAANALHIYTLCDPAAAKLATLELPPGQQIGARGAFAGDFDGDGREDLLVVAGGQLQGTEPAECEEDAGSGQLLYVGYGVGDGTFHDSPNPPADSPGSGRAAPIPLPVGSELLAVAELDGDQRADLVLEDGILFSSRFTDDCPFRELSCIERHKTAIWAAAVAADLNRDGVVDLLGAPFDARELTFAMGRGGGAFNDFAVPIQGRAVPLLVSCEQDAVSSSGKTLSVGDFDGDLTDDVAFVEQPEREPEHVALNVLFGVPLGTPAAPRRIAAMASISELSSGALLRGPNFLSDLVVLAKGGKEDASEGVGLFAGRTDRSLFSPLALPLQEQASDARGRVLVVDVVLGRFGESAVREPRCTSANPAAARLDLAVLAHDQRDQPLLYLIENKQSGLETANIQPPRHLTRPVPLGGVELAALDLDGAGSDGREEVVVYPLSIAGDEFRYHVARPAEDGVSEFAAALRGLPAGTALQVLPRSSRTRDLDGDGRRDLLLLAESTGADDTMRASYGLVLPNLGDGRFGTGAVFALPPTESIALLNIDDDVALELAAATDVGIQLFDIQGEPTQATSRLALAPGERWYSVDAGDFDADGVDDLAAVPFAIEEVMQIFWGKERAR